ncbi:MAG: hypothetical protein CMJ78_25105 [Planctomycetaceae bacterium]|nr:hypothetical protein [Planctomycetaceae bacterium]
MKQICSFVLLAYLIFNGSELCLGDDPKVPFPPKDKLPRVPDGFEITVFAGEPLFYKPTSLCFDAKGRAMVGQGPQYHLSKSMKDTDSVVILTDTDGDGVADQRKVFATGFNSIQGLAWKGNDLYVANSPELTVVRDLDGDDVADEYVIIYTDLGNHEHALHGLVWGPDGRLYMSKGNSKGHNQPEKYGRVAPKAFRDLWDVEHPKGAADIPPPKKYTAETYRSTYHDPHDDWGRQGGVLRCDPMGANLEILSRGMRNPWDIAIDDGFNIIGTDNDQTQGDRIIMPFYGAHFGWGHKYSSHWTGENNLPTVPVSGPMMSGSWAGITYYDHPNFPANYRGVFIINDWLFGTYVYRPDWKGALRTSADGSLEPFIQRREGGMIYRPTDLEFGPDGAIYSMGWGGNYHYEKGAEGSWIFRIAHQAQQKSKQQLHRRPPSRQSGPELLSQLGPDTIPARRVKAQDELVRRGRRAQEFIVSKVGSDELSTGQQTWAVWVLARNKELVDQAATSLQQWASPSILKSSKPTARQSTVPRNLRVQALRILAFRAKRFGETQPLAAAIARGLSDPDPRIRFETAQAAHQADLKSATDQIVQRLTQESDRLVAYAGWQAIRDLATLKDRRELLDHASSKMRLAALLGLQEDFEVSQKDVLELVDRETDPTVQSWALTFAINPTPPAKLSNDTLRIEMEQTVSVAQMIKRARETKRPELRRLYLQMLARVSVREGEQQQQLLDFYRTLKPNDERAIILPAAATTLSAFPDLWSGLAEPSPLSDAAVEGFVNLHRLRIKQMKSNEGAVRSTARNLSDITGFAVEIANRILEELALARADDDRVGRALTVLNLLPLPEDSSLDKTSFDTLVNVLENGPATRRATLRLLSKLAPSPTLEKSRFASVFQTLCKTPDASLYRELQAVKDRFSLSIEVPKPKAATIADVLANLDKADASRGRELFFDRVGGAGCASCHRIRGKGSDVGPDLSGVGIRLTPENIAKAIIKPSADITEGYALQVVQTEAGQVHSGAVIKETSITLTLLRSDGTQINIVTKDIESRKRQNQSVMPTGYDLFGASQLADLTAWLRSLKDGVRPTD